MSEQLDLTIDVPVDEQGNIAFKLHGCEYRILYDGARPRLKPAWYVQRMSDYRVTERYYTWPDGAFSAVLWGRCKWVS